MDPVQPITARYEWMCDVEKQNLNDGTQSLKNNIDIHHTLAWRAPNGTVVAQRSRTVQVQAENTLATVTHETFTITTQLESGVWRFEIYIECVCVLSHLNIEYFQLHQYFLDQHSVQNGNSQRTSHSLCYHWRMIK
jgi:hypothetical protein